jgi:DNA-binding PadR family transcriptional regulator
MVGVMILRAVEHLSPNATTNGVIDFIEEQTGDIVDVAQVYMALQQFSKPTVDLIHEGPKLETTAGHRSSSTFSITAKGKEAITRVRQHLDRIQEYLDKTEVAPTKKVRNKTTANAGRRSRAPSHHSSPT